MGFSQSIFRNSVFFLVLIPLFAVWGFWVTYFTRPAGSYYYWEHIHGFALFGWCILLASQAFLIRTNRRSLHRTLGRVSWLLGPLVVVSTIFLGNYKLNLRQLSDDGLYTFGLQFFLGSLFAWFWLKAMWHRRQPELHARWMICTGLTMLDPIFARIILVNFYPVPLHTGHVQLMTFALVDVILLWLIYRDWKSASRQLVFLHAFGLFLVAQAAMLSVWNSPQWKSFCAWFAGLPLT